MFENIVLPEIDLGISMKSLIVIDEIGKMELFSEKFRQSILNIFRSDIRILASILFKSHPFCDNLKAIKGLHLMKITGANRDQLVDEILRVLT
jgi:nucleoside-triphosphatase